jgi:SWI/SNF-related matrix-associated actin-dependent regulator of chromatin subfamily A-like protein 1
MWPCHEFQLARVMREGTNGDVLGCRIITSDETAPEVQDKLNENNIPVAVQPITGGCHFYMDRKFYKRAAYLLGKKPLSISPLPPPLAELLQLARDPPPQADAKEGTAPVEPTIPKGMTVELWGQLKRYQKEAIVLFERCGGRLLLADDCGLGKTVQAIAGALMYRQQWPILIVCPSSVKTNWSMELQKWGKFLPGRLKILKTTADVRATFGLAAPSKVEGKKAPTATGGRKRKAKAALPTRRRSAPAPDPVDTRRLHKYDVYIISYDLLVRQEVFDGVEAQRFQVLIVDESQYIRHLTAQRTKRVMQLSWKAHRVFLLSGTCASRPEELYPQLVALQPDLFPPFWIPPPFHINLQDKYREYSKTASTCSFSGRWCDPRTKSTFGGRYTWEHNGAARLEELYAIGREFCFLRRTKDEVLTELPEKIRDPIVFDVPEKERIAIETEMNAIKPLREKKPLEYKARYMKLWNDLPRLKLPFVTEYLSALLTDGEMYNDKTLKCLIFAHHRTMIAGIEDIVRKQGYKFITITGSTPAAKRQDLVNVFQTDPDVRIAVLSLTAAGYGLNLQAASLIIKTQLHFSPAVQIQAEDRAYRLGQKKNVIIRYLVAQSTLDEVLLRTITRKHCQAGKMMEGVSASFEMNKPTEIQCKATAEIDQEDAANISVDDLPLDD